jgi:hypothetical protein
MSYDSYTREYHLTRSGWVPGTASYDTDKVERPVDTVETWLQKVQHSSPYALQDIDWERLWVSDTVSSEERASLNSKFAHPRIAADEASRRSWQPKKKRRQPE